MLRTMQVYKRLDKELRDVFKIQFSYAEETAKECECTLKTYVEMTLWDDLGIEFDDERQLNELVEELRLPIKTQRAMRVVDMMEE